MSRQVVTNVFKDKVSTYTDRGCQRAISADSTVLGMDNNLYLDDYPVSTCEGGSTILPITALKLRTPDGETLWVDETQASWDAKVNAIGCCAVDSAAQITVTGDVEVPAGNILTMPGLYNVVPGIISKGGVIIYNVPYSSGVGVGSLDLTGFGGLGAGETIQITYIKILS